MKNTDRFSGHAKAYDQFRPNYPTQMYDFLKETFNLTSNSTIADVGAGTGIVTTELAKRFKTVYAVEPNTDMKSILAERFKGNPHVQIVNATAENTMLANHSVNFVIVAQAFHWFDGQAFKSECSRILKTGGHTILLWNIRDTKNLMIKELGDVCRKCCPSFSGFSNGMSFSGDSIPENIQEFFAPKETSVKQFSNCLTLDKNTFIGRQLSASYAPLPDQKNYHEFVDGLSKIFDVYQSGNGTIIMPYHTVCFMTVSA